MQHTIKPSYILCVTCVQLRAIIRLLLQILEQDHNKLPSHQCAHLHIFLKGFQKKMRKLDVFAVLSVCSVRCETVTGTHVHCLVVVKTYFTSIAGRLLL